MLEQREMESYAILLGGGLVILGLLIFGPPPAPRSFYLGAAPCDPEGVMEWLRRKRTEGKITADDVDRLLNTPIPLNDWLETVMLRRGFNILDVFELAPSCSPAAAAVTSSPCPCPPFCP